MEMTLERFKKVAGEMIRYSEIVSENLNESDKVEKAMGTSEELGRLLTALDYQTEPYIKEAARVLREIRWMRVRARCEIIRAKAELDKKITKVYSNESA